jgi:hypothetical protein
MSRHKEWERFGAPLLERLRIFQQGAVEAMIILQRRSHHLSRRGVPSSIQNGRPPDRGHRPPRHSQGSTPIPGAPIRWCTPAMIRSAACSALPLSRQKSYSNTKAGTIFLMPVCRKRLMRSCPDLKESPKLRYTRSRSERGLSVGKIQRVYSKEFKEEAVRLTPTSGKPVAQIARERGISECSKYPKAASMHGESA